MRLFPLCLGVMLCVGCGHPNEKPIQQVTAKAERVRLRESFGEDNPSVTSLAFDPDGKTLASGHVDGTIRLWDVATGKVIKMLEGHADAVSSVVFWPDGKTLGSGSLDRKIKIWTVATGKPNASLEGHSGGVTSMILNSDGNTLASESHDRTIKLWDVATNTEIKTLDCQSFGVSSIAFRPDGKTLASGSANSEDEIRLWDVESGEVTKTLVCPRYGGIACLVFSPDGKTLVVGGKSNWIIQWDVEKTIVIAMAADAHPGRAASSLAFSPDGKTLASSDKDSVSAIRLWNMTDIDQRKPVYGNIPSLECVWSSDSGSGVVAFSPDGKTLASGRGPSRKGLIIFWDVIP